MASKEELQSVDATEKDKDEKASDNGPSDELAKIRANLRKAKPETFGPGFVQRRISEASIWGH